MKICCKCREDKDDTDFVKSKRNASGLAAWCKACHTAYYLANKVHILAMRRNQILKRKYGISAEQYEELLAAQGGVSQ